MRVDQPLCHHFVVEGFDLFRNPFHEIHIPLPAVKRVEKGIYLRVQSSLMPSEDPSLSVHRGQTLECLNWGFQTLWNNPIATNSGNLSMGTPAVRKVPAILYVITECHTNTVATLSRVVTVPPTSSSRLLTEAH